jgi:uncharacterized protein (TIGR02996 family)
MSDADALLAAIRAAPDDDAPRLIYADWLEEHGQPGRAEFIRVQCELARNDSPTLRQREAELLAAHHDAFAGSLAAPGLRFRFRRGFVIGFGHTGIFGSVTAGFSSSQMLRFFPNGQLIKSFMTRTPGRIADYFASSNPYVQQGEYALDPLDEVADMRFRFRDEARWSYRGQFDGETLAVLTRVQSRSPMRMEFKHVHIADFNSFQDSPQDAV